MEYRVLRTVARMFASGLEDRGNGHERVGQR